MPGLASAARIAKTHGAFLLPHLRAGMRVLDCGCGPGSITLGLAEVVAPGEVVGINIEVSQIELARAETAKRNITNVRFDVADAHNLDFSDATFDAVVGHTILMQFRDPSPVLKELSRVLKPGGLAGFREPAFDGNLCEPPNGARRQYSTLFNRMLDHNGNDPRVGRRLGGLMHHMGFGRVNHVQFLRGGGDGRRQASASRDSVRRRAGSIRRLPSGGSARMGGPRSLRRCGLKERRQRPSGLPPSVKPSDGRTPRPTHDRGMRYGRELRPTSSP